MNERTDKYTTTEVIKLQAKIVNATSKLYDLGYRVETKYLEGAGWASEIVNMNTGENNELNEQEIIDAEQEKNQDYALDNMTCDNEPRPFPGMEGKGIDGGSNE